MVRNFSRRSGYSHRYCCQRRGGIIADNVDIDNLTPTRPGSRIPYLINKIYEDALALIKKREESRLLEQESLDDQLDKD